MKQKVSFQKLMQLEPRSKRRKSNESSSSRYSSQNSCDPYFLDTAILQESKPKEFYLGQDISAAYKDDLTPREQGSSTGQRLLSRDSGSLRDPVIQPVYTDPVDESDAQESTHSVVTPIPRSQTRMMTNITKRKKSAQPSNNKQLRKIIKQERIKQICRKFIEKLKINNAQSQPINYSGFKKESKDSWLQNNGIEVTPFFENMVALVSIVLISLLIVMYTLSLAFKELRESSFLLTLQMFSLAFYLIEILYSCVTTKSFGGRKITTYCGILHHYLEEGLIIDAINLIILLSDVYFDIEALLYIRLFIVLKLPQCLSKIEKLQIYFIKNYYYEQYWSLAKVFIFNFCFAHFLAILLTAMASINSTNNWQIAKGIASASWQQRYIWAYYWSANIMLTVGFGDIAASTHHQALCLVFIEFVSVICLAYNINWVGTLISNIRAQDIEKGKNFKTFKQLADKYNLEPELEWKINNYIEESVNIRKKFNVEEENQFLDRLPKDLKVMYLKQSNRSLFQQLPFFSQLVDRTLSSFAQQIEMHISHPEETLRHIDDDYNLLILRDGKVGYSTKRRNCNYNEMVMDQVSVKQTGNPFLLGLEFLTRCRPNFEIKSLVYSVIYWLDYEKLINTLKESTMDYMHFCFLRDKQRSNLDEFGVIPCQFCPDKKHTKFTCPKLHFVPLVQHAIHKEIQRTKVGKCSRRPNDAYQRPKSNALMSNKIYTFMQENIRTLADMELDFAEQNRRDCRNSRGSRNSSMLGAKKHQKGRRYALADYQTPEGQVFQLASKNLRFQEQALLQKTEEIIRDEFSKLKQSNQSTDEVWLIKSDEMCDLTHYFPLGNPRKLEDIYVPQEPNGDSTKSMPMSQAYTKNNLNTIKGIMHLEDMEFGPTY